MHSLQELTGPELDRISGAGLYDGFQISPGVKPPPPQPWLEFRPVPNPWIVIVPGRI